MQTVHRSGSPWQFGGESLEQEASLTAHSVHKAALQLEVISSNRCQTDAVFQHSYELRKKKAISLGNFWIGKEQNILRDGKLHLDSEYN